MPPKFQFEKASYKMGHYKISTDPDYLNDRHHITPEIQRILTELRPGVEKGKKHLVRKLTNYCTKYPKVPAFKNHLTILHKLNNNHEKAEKINRRLVKDHPNYIFGKINLATAHLEKGESEEALKILGANLEIQELYPDRDEFHVEEVMAFNYIVVIYFLVLENMAEAQTRLAIMEEIEIDHPKTLMAKMACEERKIEILEDEKDRLEEELWEKEEELLQKQNTIKKEIIAKRRTNVQQTEPPTFNFPEEMQALYEHNIDMDSEQLEHILHLERTPLITDLCAILKDSIVRFEFFREKEASEGYDHKNFSFVLHALLLLADLRAEEAIGDILEALKQDDDYTDLWFSDYLFDAGTAAVFWCGKNHTDKLMEYLKLPVLDTYCKNCVSNAVIKIPALWPEKRSEIIASLRELLQFYIEKITSDEYEYLDTEFFGFLVADLSEAGYDELLPEIEQLFTNDMVDLWICGLYETIEEEITFGKTDDLEMNEINRDIFEKYEVLKRIASEDDFYAGHDSFFDEEEDDFSTARPLRENYQTVVKPQKIGRNDPCPCGSGKKYKKCCMNLD